MNLLNRLTHRKCGIESCILEIYLQHFRLTDIEAISNKEDQFFKIRVTFRISYLRSEVGKPHFFRISDRSYSLTSCRKRFIKISMLKDFRANVLKFLMEHITNPLGVKVQC